MKPKKKPCKGIGKAKDFKGCSKEVFKRVHGLCTSCYPKWLLTTPEGQEKLQRATLKATKPRRELEQAIEDDKNHKKLRALLEGARIACHTYIRERDKGKPCISCKAPYSKSFHAGHWKKAEIYSNLKFNEFNINGQCERCNIFLDGNVQAYADNIGSRIGEEKKQEIELQAKLFKQMDFKWDRQELIDIRKHYQNKLKELKKNQ